MADFADLIQKTRRRLEPVGITETLTLSANIAAGATSLGVTDASGTILASLQPGQTLGIDLEVFFVLSITSSTVSVVPGYSGSTEAAHSSGALVRVNPRFSDFDISTAINDDLVDLSSAMNGLFQVQSVEITYNPSIAGYDLAGVTAINEILSIRYKVPYPIGKWIPLTYGQ